MLLAVIGGALAIWLARRRRGPAATALDPDDPNPGVPTPALNDRANTALVELDDALRTSERELAMARDQYGPEATAAFDAALTTARGEVAEAFRLRLLLDEEPAASDERERRRLLTEILRLSTAADGRLDAEADAFDDLRQTEANLEQELPRLRERVQALHGPPARGRGEAGAAAGPVRRGGARGRARQSRAGRAATQPSPRRPWTGRPPTSAATDRPAAAVAVRGAEQAVDQVGALLDAVGQAGTDLDAARDALPALISEVETDLAAARAAADPSTVAGDAAAEAAR